MKNALSRFVLSLLLLASGCTDESQSEISNAASGQSITVHIPQNIDALFAFSSKDANGNEVVSLDAALVSPQLRAQVLNELNVTVQMMRHAMSSQTSPGASVTLRKIVLTEVESSGSLSRLAIDGKFHSTEATFQPEQPDGNSSTPRENTNAIKPTVVEEECRVEDAQRASDLNGEIEFALMHTLYRITFYFEDKANNRVGGTGGELLVYPVKNQIDLVPYIKVRAKGEISIDKLARLPGWLGKLLASTLLDINLSLKASYCWYSKRTVPTSMSYLGRGSTTEFERDLMQDVVAKLCVDTFKTRGYNTQACSVGMNAPGNPLEDLVELSKQKLMRATACYNAETREGLSPLFLIYAVAPVQFSSLLPGSKAHLFQRKNSDWYRRSGGVMIGEGTLRSEVGRSTPSDIGRRKVFCRGATENDRCLVFSVPAWNFSGACAEIGTNREERPFAFADSTEDLIVE